VVTRELTTDLQVLERLVGLDGSDVLDVGCGSGALVRELVARGARAVGLEVSEQQLGQARTTGIGRFVVGRAEELPLPDGSLDAVMFMRSLHHVPEPAMIPALADARRVLRPGGLVYVAEPLAEGDYFTLVSIVDDETEVRTAAQRALDDCGRAGLERMQTLDYDVALVSTGIDALRERVVDVDPERAVVFDAHEGELAAAFARLGDEHEGGRRFTQPMRADLLRPSLVNRAGESV
jgi:SAM-dependent methyltransferase